MTILGGPNLKISKALSQFKSKSNIVQQDANRISINVSLASHAIFSTHGVFNNEFLPMIYHSHKQKEHPTGTHKRYTVQALPISTHLPPLSELYEVCCIRGFPDNIQAVAALFGIIRKDLSPNVDCAAFPLLPIFHYSFSSRI